MADNTPDERYEIRSKIGQGGIGAVYRAFDHSLKRDVAIKRLLPQGEKPEEERYAAEEIVREAGMLSKLQHPNILTVYDAGIDDDGGFVVMELIEGETIDQTINRGGLDLKAFLLIAEQALEGLIAAQDIGMLHRDIKPSNVMLRSLPSGKFQLKLLDFGLAKVTQKPALQTVRHGDSILGSMHFMAPEQFEREELDGRTDLYSLGCLFYYALSGKYPFDGESSGEVMVKKLEHDFTPLAQQTPTVPPSISAFVMRLMARHADHRPTDAQQALVEFIAARDAIKEPPQKSNPLLAPAVAATGPVRPATAAVAAQAHPQSTTAHFTRPPGTKKSKAPLTLAAAFLVLAAGGGWYLFGNRSGDNPAATEAPANQSKDTSSTGEKETPPAPNTKPVTLVASGSLWNYWDEGSAPHKSWRGKDYKMTEWKQGPAPLGYGDPVETKISFGPDPDNKHISYFFRHQFKAKKQDITGLKLRLLVDDGGIVYLNGKEIARQRMSEKQWPGINETATEPAWKEEENTWLELNLKKQLLYNGTNQLAVRVHQDRAKSTDLRFDLELVGKR